MSRRGCEVQKGGREGEDQEPEVISINIRQDDLYSAVLKNDTSIP